MTKELYRNSWGGRSAPYTIPEAVAYTIDRWPPDGEIERLRDQVSNLTEMLGQLIEELHGTQLNDSQVERLLSIDFTFKESP